MDAPLLTTKLCLPPLRPDLVIRPRLLQRLDEGLRCKLTLLSAPAGFGKTTLLASWAAGLSGRAQVAWFSIDPADNDPGRFIEYLVSALQQSNPGLVNTAAFLLRQPRLRLEPFLATLINELSANTAPLVLILDDYHLIDEQAIHQAIDFLLEHQPAHFHLLLATRADPPLHLSRLRGRGQLNEVRLADLRFTTQEAAAFLNQAMGLSLVPDQVASLASRTEGWIAGLQLAALSLRGQEDPARFVSTFTGSNRFILDYLTEEVFQSQPAHRQDFLRQTAILDRLNGPLCDAVCQSAPGASQKILEDLERLNLFILPLDDRREWRRYHQLFADLLLQRLQQDQPDQIPDLYRRASLWFEQNALPYEAVEYAFSAGDPERTAGLIENVSQVLLMHGNAATLLRWLERLPQPLLDRRHTLAVSHAWALLLCSRPLESIQNCLDRIDAQSSALPGRSGAQEIAGRQYAIHTLPLRAMLALYRGQIDQAVAMALEALDHLEKDQVYLRGIASLVYALSIAAGDNLEQYLPAVQQAAAAGEKSGNLMVTALGLVSLAENEKKLGRLRQSHAHLQQALQLAVDAEGRRLPIAGRVLIGLADLRREWNDLDQARYMTQEGIDLLEQTGFIGAFAGYMNLARIEHALGNVGASRQAVHKAAQSALAFDLTDIDDQTVALLDARLSILQGDLTVALRWAEKRRLLTGTGSTPAAVPAEAVPATPYDDRFRKYELVILARLWLAQARPDQALSLLATVLPEFERVNRPAMRLEIRLLQALACRLLGDTPGAMHHLEQALALAEPEGFIRTFLDEGEPILALLRLASSHSPAARRSSTQAYIRQLLAAAGEPVPAAPSSAPAGSLIEALSAREIAVLRLLEGSLSVQEIADELVVSPNTVHSHIKRIYVKLDVHSRYQAVARAKELKLL